MTFGKRKGEGKKNYCKQNVHWFHEYGLNLFDKVEDIWDYESGRTGGRMDTALVSYVWMLLFVVKKFLFSHLDICVGRGLLDFIVKCTTSFCLQHGEPLHGLCHSMAGDFTVLQPLWLRLSSNPTWFLYQSSNFPIIVLLHSVIALGQFGAEVLTF